MFFAKRPTGIALSLCFLGATIGSSALADSFTGKTNGVCAAVTVIACTDDLVCRQGNARTFDMPSFMFIDIEKGIIRPADASMEGDVSTIKTKEITETSVILQGYANHRGWTVAINRADGTLNLSSTGPDVNFMISGNCIAL
jgi:hypothetical protein